MEKASWFYIVEDGHVISMDLSTCQDDLDSAPFLSWHIVSSSNWPRQSPDSESSDLLMRPNALYFTGRRPNT